MRLVRLTYFEAFREVVLARNKSETKLAGQYFNQWRKAERSKTLFGSSSSRIIGHVLEDQVYQSQLRLKSSVYDWGSSQIEREIYYYCMYSSLFQTCFKPEPSSIMKHRHRELHSQVIAETRQRHGHEP